MSVVFSNSFVKCEEVVAILVKDMLLVGWKEGAVVEGVGGEKMREEDVVVVLVSVEWVMGRGAAANE